MTQNSDDSATFTDFLIRPRRLTAGWCRPQRSLHSIDANVFHVVPHPPPLLRHPQRLTPPTIRYIFTLFLSLTYPSVVQSTYNNVVLPESPCVHLAHHPL